MLIDSSEISRLKIDLSENMCEAHSSLLHAVIESVRNLAEISLAVQLKDYLV